MASYAAPAKISTGFRFTFSVPGDQLAQIDSVFAGVSMAARDLRPAWDAISKRFVKMSREQFASEGVRGGAKWAALSPAYAKRKRAKYGSRKILAASGRLRGALTGGVGHLRVSTADSLRIGVNDAIVPHGKYHQAGTLGGFGRSAMPTWRQAILGGALGGMPRRPPIQVTEADRATWLMDVRRALLKPAQRGTGPGTSSYVTGGRY